MLLHMQGSISLFGGKKQGYSPKIEVGDAYKRNDGTLGAKTELRLRKINNATTLYKTTFTPPPDVSFCLGWGLQTFWKIKPDSVRL